MSDLTDRQLIIALRQTGWDGLVTNNYKMLDIPDEVAAIVATKLTVVAIESAGEDPIRATGALLLLLPDLARRNRPDNADVYRLGSRPRSVDAWDYFSAAARKKKREPGQLWAEVKVSRDELVQPVLTDLDPPTV